MAKEARNVLVPVEDADDCERALLWILENFYRRGDTIYILHVVPHSQSGYRGMFVENQESEQHQVEMRAEQARGCIQDRFIPRLEAAGADYHVLLVHGAGDSESIGEIICAKADELDAALIAMAAHNKGRFVRFIVGSVTQYCMRQARGSVLVYQEGSARMSSELG